MNGKRISRVGKIFPRRSWARGSLRTGNHITLTMLMIHRPNLLQYRASHGCDQVCTRCTPTLTSLEKASALPLLWPLLCNLLAPLFPRDEGDRVVVVQEKLLCYPLCIMSFALPPHQVKGLAAPRDLVKNLIDLFVCFVVSRQPRAIL